MASVNRNAPRILPQMDIVKALHKCILGNNSRRPADGHFPVLPLRDNPGINAPIQEGWFGLGGTRSNGFNSVWMRQSTPLPMALPHTLATDETFFWNFQ